MRISWLETVSAAMAMGLGGLVHLGGIQMSVMDYLFAFVLAGFCSFIAALNGEGTGKAFWLNFALGIVVGYLLAHFILVGIRAIPGLTMADSALFSLAPICSLFSAKLARMIISDDQIAERILNKVKSKLGGGNGQS